MSNKPSVDSQSGKRTIFSSNLGFMMAAIGGAVGLGNIWSFPFKCGRGGGFPFLVIYVACVFIVGVPLAMAEYSIGRKMRCGPIEAYSRIGKKFAFLGWINTAVCVGVMGFYCLICGWVLKYTCMFGLSLVGLGGTFGATESSAYFASFVSGSVEPLIWTVVFMVVNYLVVRHDVAGGIEKACKILIPVLTVILVIVAVRSCTLPGAKAGLDYLFKPNMDALRANGGFFPIMTLALLQMFFSVNIGFGTNLLYGSYLPDESSITRSAIMVPIADMIIAILAGLAVMPAVFAFGYEPSAGAGLLFVTLKAVFDDMPGGNFFGFLFFVAVLFAALSSTIGMTGAIAAYGTDNRKWTNEKSSLIATIIPVIIAIPVSLGYGVLSGVRPLSFIGKDTDMLDSLDFICENCLVTIGTLLLSIFIGWVWKPDFLIEEIEKNGTFTWKKLWTVIIRYVSPIVAGIILLSSIGLI